MTIAVKKLGFLDVAADLAVTEGTITVDAGGRIVQVTAAVDAASYTSGNAKRDTHVRSEDFLDADRHPEIRFTTTRVDTTGPGHRATGVVSLKGTNTPITLDVDQVRVQGNSASFSARATVDRGVDKMPSFIVGNKLELTISAHATLAPATEAP